MAHFNALDDIFGRLNYRIKFKEKHPQCMDCQYVEDLVFSMNYYEKIMKEKICINCDKYNIDKVGE